MTLLQAVSQQLIAQGKAQLADLVDAQSDAWEPGTSGWGLVPEIDGPSFFLVAEDLEGLRRGTEVVSAFIAPGLFEWGAEYASLAPLAGRLPQDSGIQSARELVVGSAHDRFVLDAEELVAVAAQRPRRSDFVGVRYVDLLRDYRLSLIEMQLDQAEALLERIRLSGELSRENMRFLRIELLGRFGRWEELQGLPTLNGILEARRPRTVNEILLQMVWFAEISQGLALGKSARRVVRESGLLARYGKVLGAVDFPLSREGRRVKALQLLESDDQAFADFVHRCDESERPELLALAQVSDELEPLPRDPEQHLTTFDRASRLLREGDFRGVLELLSAAPTGGLALLGLDAALELEDPAAGAAVLAILDPFIAAGELTPTRRVAGHLAELRAIAEGTCESWADWLARVASSTEWPDASRTIRAQHDDWPAISDSSASALERMPDLLEDAATGCNEPHLTAALDIWCLALAEEVGDPRIAPLAASVLDVLASQHAVSDSVRVAFLRLLDAVIVAGPDRADNGRCLESARSLLSTADSVAGVDWCLSLGELLVELAAVDRGLRDELVSAIVGQLTRYAPVMSHRQQLDAAALASTVGMDGVIRVHDERTEEAGRWARLDGRSVGLYTLLPSAIERFTERLTALCSPREVVGNAQKTATEELRNLARRADYLIVDTWHAAHQATHAIDAVRGKDQQVLPRGRGVSAFLRALEQAL